MTADGRHRRAVVLVLAVVLGVPAVASGQAQEARGGYAGLDGGVMFDSPRPFSEAISACASETTYSYGVRGGYRFARYVGVEASFVTHGESAAGCVSAPVRVPENGTLTHRDYREGIEGYPYFVLSGRAVLWSPAVLDLLRARVYGGGGLLTGKDLAAGLAGGGIRVGTGRVRGTLDLEVWRTDLPFTTVTRTYENGQVVSTSREPGEQDASPLLLRVGVTWSF
ncbi:MAG: hypothetical protein Q8W44_02995 [Candidatus Palauibacterales bacterium]|nr:hypothetical protein [Candidatus Palauibacterales bacterium]